MPNERIMTLIEDAEKEIEELIQKVDDYDQAVKQYSTKEKPNVYTLGKLIYERNVTERKLRHYSASFLNIYGYNKCDFRDFIVGYCVNDDGIAIDADGKPLPSSKVSKDGIPIKHDEDVDKCGDTYKIRIGEDKYCEISRKDTALIKEILANYDIPTLDGIVNQYAKNKDKIANGEYAEVISKSISHELRHAPSSKKRGHKHIEASELFSTDVSLGKLTRDGKNKK